MIQKRKRTAIAAWLAFALAVLATATYAQSEWVTTLNDTTSTDSRARPAFGTVVAQLSDGSTVVAGATACCTRDLQLLLLDHSGIKVWDRWITDRTGSEPKIALVVQSDDSVSVYYDAYCVARFSRSGDKLAQTCANTDISVGDLRYAPLPNGDIIAAFGSRTVIRIDPSGRMKWRARDEFSSDSYGSVIASGINSDGDYYELTNKVFRVWRGADGSLIINRGALGPCCTESGGVSFPSVALPDQSLITVEHVTDVPASVGTISIAKYSNDGTVVWRRPGLLPNYEGRDPSNWFLAAVGDGSGDVLFASGVDKSNGFASPRPIRAYSSVTRISGSGVIMWQQNIDGAFRIVQMGAELLALGTAAANDFFTTVQAFPINVANGSVGVKREYFPPNNTPDSAYRVFGPELLSTPSALIIRNHWPTASLHLLDLNLQKKWSHAITHTIAGALDDDEAFFACTAKRLVRNEDRTWWARLMSSPYQDRWLKVPDLDGTISVRGPLRDVDCGFAMTADNGRISANPSLANRIQKVDANGIVVWTAPGNLSVDGYFARGPNLVATHSDGDVVYSTNEVLGRVSSTGSRRYEIRVDQLNNYGTSRFLLQVDNANNSILYGHSVQSGAVITRVTSEGTTLTSVAYPSICDTYYPSVLTNGEISVAGCGAVHRIGVDGTLRWSRALIQPISTISAIASDSLGNVFVGGCYRTNLIGDSNFGGIVVSSWDSAGVDRWQKSQRVAFNTNQCVSALAPDALGGVYASVVAPGTLYSYGGETFLAHFDASGRELWRHTAALSARMTREADMVFGDDGFLHILAAEADSEFGLGRITLRKVNVAALPSPLRVTILEIPVQAIAYRDAFRMRVGITQSDGSPALALSPTVIRLGVHQGSGIMLGNRGCVVPVGQSNCLIDGIIYSERDQAATIWVSADGMSTLVSPPLSFAKSPTNPIISVVGAPPYVAYTYRRVVFSLFGASLTSLAVNSGRFTGSFTDPASELFGYECNTYNSTQVQYCNFLVRSATARWTATYAAATFPPGNDNYFDSVAAPLSIYVQKVLPTMRIEADAANIFVEGEPLVLRVSLFVANGVNVTKFVADGALRANGVNCAPPTVLGTVQNGFVGSYARCTVIAAPRGRLAVTVAFSGSDDLLPTADSVYSTEISPRAELNGTGSFSAGTQVCASGARTRCTVVDAGNWRCIGPQGMTGQVFFQPATGDRGHYSLSPVRFLDIRTIQSGSGNVNFVASSTACVLDVDGDGARLAYTDGVLILRRMLGISNSALVAGATHSCVPRSATDITWAIDPFVYDIDGDGQTHAATDGLLLLRAMLGFRGDSLIKGVIGVNASRKSAVDIENFLTNSCAYNVN